MSICLIVAHVKGKRDTARLTFLRLSYFTLKVLSKDPVSYSNTLLNDVTLLWRERTSKNGLRGESVHTFIQDLYRPGENCDYGTLKDDLI